jgi:hypothetical protein
MRPSIRDLVLLTLFSAFLCGLTWVYQQPIATAVFAALTCCIGIITAKLARSLVMASRTDEKNTRLGRGLRQFQLSDGQRRRLAGAEAADFICVCTSMSEISTDFLVQDRRIRSLELKLEKLEYGLAMPRDENAIAETNAMLEQARLKRGS